MHGDIAKPTAVKLVNGIAPELGITLQNTVFANINHGKSVWWMTPDNKKFRNNFFIILNDNNTQLYIFFIPANSIPAPMLVFHQRRDNRSSIEIYTQDSTFTEARKKNLSFQQFLRHCVPITNHALPSGMHHSDK